ncbi:MAG: PD40 domain-containing protein, partial [Gammaproteobacteria bacterium]
MKILARELIKTPMHTLVKWVGLAFLCLAIPLINACDSGGSSSGDGIDPGIVEVPVAFIKRPVPLDDMGNDANIDLREPRLFMAGGDVYLRTSSASDATLTNITRSVTNGIGDVKGLNANHDGTRLIFSLRLFDPDPNNPPFPTWNVYEYDLETSQLRRIISSQTIAEQGDDLYPTYLPDGRILFTSNRQKQSQEMLNNEGKTRYAALDEDEGIQALVLHVMDASGDPLSIRQVSFNQSHDLYPQVLTHFNGGRIVFSRWDNAAGNNEVNIYTANPDGSEMQILYGSQSHATGSGGANIQFTNLREMDNGDLMVITKPFDGTFDGGAIEIIGVDRFKDINKPIWSLRGTPGPGQTRATVSNVNNSGALSLTGRYSSAFPLWDGSNRMLVTKSTCRLDVNGVQRPCIDPYLSDPAAVEKSPAYGIWLYDREDDTQRPVVLAEAGMVMTDVITVQNRTRAPIIFDKKLLGQLDSGWELDQVGVVNIKSVYDMGDGTFNGCFFTVCTTAPAITTVQVFSDPTMAIAAERPARFVRFVKPVGIPDPNDPLLVNPPDLANNAFGPQRILGMREIVGYAPVEPDGSVKVKVPSNIPLAVEVLDGEGRRIGPRHDNWFQVQPGDTLTCVGCHDLNNGGSPPEVHARSDGEAPS